MTFRRMTPAIQARDFQESVKFYTEVLAFEVLGIFPQDDPTWCHIQAGGADLMLVYIPPHDHGPDDDHDHEPAFSGSLYFYPDDLDDVLQRIQANGVEVNYGPEVMPYGMREFGITDPNGYSLQFGVEAPAEQPG